jgi:hypothetical protein
MVKQIRRLIFLLFLCSVLAGFTVEQLSLFCAKEKISLTDYDPEQKEGSKTKKMNEDDTFRPEHFPVIARVFMFHFKSGGLFPDQSCLYRSLACRTILTPPPERA